MLATIAKEKAQEINRLHGQIQGLGEKAFKRAIRIGEILTQIKEELPHGEWLRFLEANVDFSERTARNYMAAFRYQVRFTSANFADLAIEGRMPEGNVEPLTKEERKALEEHQERIGNALLSTCQCLARLSEIRELSTQNPNYPSPEELCAENPFLLVLFHLTEKEGTTYSEFMWCFFSLALKAVGIDDIDAFFKGEYVRDADGQSFHGQ